MGKKHSTPGEEHLLLPTPPTDLPVVDTHTHVAATFEFYRRRYKTGAYTNVFDFVKGMYDGRNVEALLDVWCEAPVQSLWREFADAAVEENGKWGKIQYWFALGAQIF
jgi:TatD DNase family protein